MNKKTKSKLSLLLQVIILIALVGGAIYYFSVYNKAAFDEFLLKYDSLGITEIGRNEINRKDAINRLNIPFEQKQALISNTIFIGATKQMVSLALGKPIKRKTLEESHEKWFYIVGETTAPIILEFQEEILAKVERGTNLDIMDNN